MKSKPQQKSPVDYTAAEKEIYRTSLGFKINTREDLKEADEVRKWLRFTKQTK